MAVGIEKLTADPSTLALDLTDLARARDRDPRYPTETLLVRRRAVLPPWEDPVTLAVNAARPLLTAADREAIGLVVVATESSPDMGKPIATYVQRWCDIQPNCRSFEVKHACYGGTAALMMAAHWVLAASSRHGKALVVTTDLSRAHLRQPWEYVLGAGAVAMLVSREPEILELDLARHGVWTTEVADTYRPSPTEEVGNADTSLMAYLDGLHGAYEDFERQGAALDYRRDLAAHLYHVPFGGMTLAAHRAILRRFGHTTADEARADFDRTVLPSLSYNAELGGVYTGAVFLALLGLCDAAVHGHPSLAPGDRLSVFSYGSGSCAEFYAPRLGAGALAAVRAVRLAERIAERRPLGVTAYEALETWRAEHVMLGDYEVDRGGLDGHYQSHYQGRERLVLRGVRGWRRDYELS